MNIKVFSIVSVYSYSVYVFECVREGFVCVCEGGLGHGLICGVCGSVVRVYSCSYCNSQSHHVVTVYAYTHYTHTLTV